MIEQLIVKIIKEYMESIVFQYFSVKINKMSLKPFF